MSFEALSDHDNHNEAKHWYAYERYLDDTMKVDVQGVFLSVEEYAVNNKVVVLAPYSYRSPSLSLRHPLVGHLVKNPSKRLMATDTTRTFISSLIHQVQEVVATQKCLAKFDVQNVVVTNKGEVKFRHVEIIAFTYEAKREMYHCTVDVITSFFGANEIPPDIQGLINLMNTQKDDFLYKISPALLLRSQRSERYTRIYEYFKYKLGSSVRDQILRKLSQLPWVINWKGTVCQNTVLQETYDFRRGSYDLKRPTDKNGNPTTAWTELEQELQMVELLLDFVRNGTAHRLQRTMSVTPEEHETILMYFYLMLLPKLQEAVYDVVGTEALKFLGLFN